MRLSSIDFLGCGFPEEYIFIGAVTLSAIIMASFVLLHLLVDKEYFDGKAWIPIVFHLFNKDAFTKLGNVIRVVLIISLLLLVVLFVGVYYLYKYEILTCGQVR